MIPGVGPLLLAAAGLVALAIATAILRSFGSGYRVGRLLAAAPRVSVAEARRIAESGESRYIRVDGRIDSDAEFEDADHKRLVLRRTTLEWRPAAATGPWVPFDTSLEAVPFVVREGLDEISVDGDAVAEGLVVVRRESLGRASDLGERAPDGISPDAQARLRIELVSSVEHATVAGVPSRSADGKLSIGPGLGRPLILTTLEGDEAMRVLTGGATGRSRLAIAGLAAGGVLIAVAAIWWLLDWFGGGAATALAASPNPSLRPGTDTRSTGGGPGLVGNPLLAVLGVLGVGLLSLLASLVYIRVTGSRQASPSTADRDVAEEPRPPGGT
jgi:hypothetical protein